MNARCARAWSAYAVNLKRNGQNAVKLVEKPHAMMSSEEGRFHDLPISPILGHCVAFPTMPVIRLLALQLLGTSHALVFNRAPVGAVQHGGCSAAASSRPLQLGRRAALLGGASAAAVSILPLAAHANTQPMLDKPMEKVNKFRCEVTTVRSPTLTLRVFFFVALSFAV